VSGSSATMPYLVGVRLTQEDKEKLVRLCTHAQRKPSELLRTLIRLAKPIDGLAVPVGFTAVGDREETCAV
jgi:hypothetical protein